MQLHEVHENLNKQISNTEAHLKRVMKRIEARNVKDQFLTEFTVIHEGNTHRGTLTVDVKVKMYAVVKIGAVTREYEVNLLSPDPGDLVVLRKKYSPGWPFGELALLVSIDDTVKKHFEANRKPLVRLLVLARNLHALNQALSIISLAREEAQALRAYENP